jgi:ribosomal protein S18 acetylase RimI-like enzyme
LLVVRIRRAVPRDSIFIRDVAQEVFAHFGPYGRLLPGWLLHPEVMTFLAEQDDGTPLGYAMLALRPFDDEEMSVDGGGGLVDLVAIAVDPKSQQRGIGRALIHYVLDTARRMAPMMGIAEVRLSVAEPNTVARRLFESEGFTIVDPAHGFYAGGQRSIRMSHALASSSKGSSSGPGKSRPPGEHASK